MSPTPTTSPKASSASEGFFQSVPVLSSSVSSDFALQRILQGYLPSALRQSIQQEFSKFSQTVLTPQILQLVEEAESHPPTLAPQPWGGEHRLITSQGWKSLQDIGISEGIVALGYDTAFSGHERVVQFLKYHIWSGSSAIVTCPSAMTDGAAALLRRHLATSALSDEHRRVFQDAYERVTSRDPAHAWTAGQWMTERTGGSDVSGTETIARYSPASQPGDGDWIIDGFKWFSSATDCGMTMLLASTPKGLSAFFAPMRKPDGNLNGVSIVRLKNKLGTKALPTAELELRGMRAWLVGKEGDGIKEISTVLNITRVHNAVSAVGFLGRGLQIVRAYAKVRQVARGQTLNQVPLFMRGLSKQTVNYTAYMHLTFFTTLLLSSPSPPATQDSLRPSAKDATLILRLVTPLLKALTAKAAIAGLAECMESLGGVGYMENAEPFNIARLFRDANVLSIWEGTTDVLATDVVRVAKHPRAGLATLEAMDRWIQANLKHRHEAFAQDSQTVLTSWSKLTTRIKNTTAEQLLPDARELMQELGHITCSVLLIVDATRDGNEVAVEIAQRWTRGTISRPKATAQDGLLIDQSVVYGHNIEAAPKL
jgi:alkylation response protein AidB-like acyl-CoA dehydrogenase